MRFRSACAAGTRWDVLVLQIGRDTAESRVPTTIVSQHKLQDIKVTGLMVYADRESDMTPLAPLVQYPGAVTRSGESSERMVAVHSHRTLR